jgi:hypothetical protein
MRRRPLHDPKLAVGARLIARGLAGTGWVSVPKRALEQVFETDADELGVTDLRNYQRATLDEVVYPGDLEALPAFAIQFERGSLRDDEVRREVTVNRLCARGKLPLLRLGAETFDELEQTSVLEWVVRRAVDWESESDALFAKAEADMAAAVAGEVLTDELIESVGLEFDPSFQFDIDHPLPGLAAIAERLRTRFDIRVLPGYMAYADRGEDARYVIGLGGGRTWHETTAVSEYHVQERTAVLYANTETEAPLAEFRASARFAHAHVIALAGDAPAVLGQLNAATGDTPLWDIAAMRAEVLDFNWLGGASPNAIARDIGFYRALSDLEAWAEQHLAALPL